MSFEMNKIIASILVAAIVAMISSIIANALVRPKMLTRNVYEIAGAAPTESKGPAATAPAAPEPVGPLLASASIDAGSHVAQKCVPCHTFDRGGGTRVGPNLYDIVGTEIAQDRGGFSFSDALRAKKGRWTPEALNEWLADPAAFAKGTRMTFAGLPSSQDRANIIAYLNSLSDNPKPLAGEAGK